MDFGQTGWNVLREMRLEIQRKTQKLAGSFALLPAVLTWLRFLGAAMIVVFIYRSFDRNVIFWVILVCAISDYLDGWAARRLGRCTYPGKVMDFIADKFFITIALISVSFYLGALSKTVACLLSGYHLLLLLSLSVISWSIHVPVVTITTGERLAVLFSYLLLIVATGNQNFPGKQIFRSLYMPIIIIALLSAFTGLLSYLRLLRRILMRIVE